jgi:RNA polymerase sigma-70 factor (TIGR02960 family)
VATVERGDFEARVGPHRAELHAYCYRMLGSLQDAEDALQEALLGAWRGMAAFEGRGSFRGWLYRIATNACLEVISKRPKRMTAIEYGAATEGVDVAAIVGDPVWLEPYPCDAAASFELRESVEIAFVAALQHLPATQRAVLILCEVLGFDAATTAELLETSVASVNSALQRARATVGERAPAKSQQATLRDLGEVAERELVAAFVDAWGRSDVDAIMKLLARDARFAMPPIPSWFDGRDSIARFFRERMFETAWRLVPMRASGQLAFACYQGPEFRLGAMNVVTLRGREIAEMTGFLDPAVHRRFSIPDR